MLTNELMTEQDVETRSGDGLVLRGRRWTRPIGAESRGTLVISHGLGEHGGCYRHVAEAVGATVDLDVVAFDFRGHGRSPGKRGVVRRFDDLTLDLRAAVEFAAGERPEKPIAVLGHSNGGLVALKTVVQDLPLPIDALVLSNPSLRLAVQVPKWKIALGKVLRATAPDLTLSAALPRRFLTRDPEFMPNRPGDPLRHTRTSAELYFGMIEQGRSIQGRAAEFRLPTLLILGGADPVVDPSASRSFFDAMSATDKTLLIDPNAVHEPLNDLERRVILADLARWLADRF